jgi:hypothetical protein
MVAVIEPSQFTGLMPGASRPQAPPARLETAHGAAVDLAAIVAPAQVEELAASSTSTLPKALVHRARESANAGR